ncbi:conserved hypothetical protein [Histoplasma capsulatum H143]|uniref:Uncharacterized protein n=1 Tax=Ajellomyces capsulatus (strain H143) TaxID=544712 RepID=C6HSM6_AJECH|nr:conserved hypothetical protein [Histoplasma capsulatum H143]
MSKEIPLIILDSDDEDELQITGTAICAQNRIDSGPECSHGVCSPTNSQQTGNGEDGQQVTTAGRTHGVAHPISPSTSEWLQPAIPIERSPYFGLPLSSPTNSLSDNSGGKNEATSPHPNSAQAESTTRTGQELKAEHVSSPSPLTKEFFMDMADAIAHIFPYGELARKHKCSVDKVNRALIAVVLDPLMKRIEGQDSCGNGNEEGEVEHAQTALSETWGSPNTLINKWNQQYQEMVSELQRESEGKSLPMEFEQILIAASGNAEAYWKERNAGFNAYQAFQNSRKNDTAEDRPGEQVGEYKSLQQQLKSVVQTADPENQSTLSGTAVTAVFTLDTKEAAENGSNATGRKRARSSSESVEVKDISHGRDSSKSAPPSPSTATSPALYQVSTPPPRKKAKTISSTSCQSTPTQTSTGESINSSHGLYGPNPKHPFVTDGASDTYTLVKFPYNRIHSTDNRPTPSPPPSTSSSGSLSPTAQTPTPLPRSRYLPNSIVNLFPNPKVSITPLPAPPRSNFTRSTRRHAVTIDKFGNYQREKPSQREYQSSAYHISSKDRDNTLLPRTNGLFPRRQSARDQQREPAESDNECDFYDPYYHAGVDRTARVFTEGLWEQLFGGFGMGSGSGSGLEDGGARELMGLDFGLEQIEVSGQGKGKGRMIGDFGGDVNGHGTAGVGEESGWEDDDAGDDAGGERDWESA